jgi:hypothetical protein
MHDPDVVAFTIPSPIPRRKRYRDAREGDPRWTLGVRRRTNDENLISWRPKGEPSWRWRRRERKRLLAARKGDLTS